MKNVLFAVCVSMALMTGVMFSGNEDTQKLLSMSSHSSRSGADTSERVFVVQPQPQPIATLGTVFWMHIQKTSSWFGDYLLLWGCPSLASSEEASQSSHILLYSRVAAKDDLRKLKCNVSFFTGSHGYGFHVPFSSPVNRSTVTLLRDPYDRMISSFLHGKGVHQMMFPIGFRDRVKLKYALRRNISSSKYPILSYASLDGMSGCQTKMVLGKDCGEITELTDMHLEEAKRRLQYDMAFVGITEDSKATADLFLAMYPNNLLSTTTLSLLNNSYRLRPRKNKDHTNKVNEQLRFTLTSNNWIDRFDGELYRFARALFHERCQAHHVRTNADYHPLHPASS
jgi:hypothetical protein